jgi:hypothetical protein
MARTKGAIGKPQTVGVKLSDLNKILKGDAVIMVDRNYLILLNQNSVNPQAIQSEQLTDEEMEVEQKVEFSFVE